MFLLATSLYDIALLRLSIGEYVRRKYVQAVGSVAVQLREYLAAFDPAEPEEFLAIEDMPDPDAHMFSIDSEVDWPNSSDDEDAAPDTATRANVQPSRVRGIVERPTYTPEQATATRAARRCEVYDAILRNRLQGYREPYPLAPPLVWPVDHYVCGVGCRCVVCCDVQHAFQAYYDIPGRHTDREIEFHDLVAATAKLYQRLKLHDVTLRYLRAALLHKNSADDALKHIYAIFGPRIFVAQHPNALSS